MGNDSEYLNFLNVFLDNLENKGWPDLIEQPGKVGVICVDMTNAFCRSGNLASDRIAALIPPVVRLFTQAWDHGVRDFVLLHDCHTLSAEEFDAFTEHSVCGSEAAEAVDEIKSLPFYAQMKIFEKNSLHPAHGTGFDEWLTQNDYLDVFIVIGDCTDLCVYQTAMHLRTTANAYDLHRRVVIPEECVNTYDLPVQIAAKIGLQPHPGDIMHKLFLHHMAVNAIEIYRQII